MDDRHVMPKSWDEDRLGAPEPSGKGGWMSVNAIAACLGVILTAVSAFHILPSALPPRAFA